MRQRRRRQAAPGRAALGVPAACVSHAPCPAILHTAARAQAARSAAKRRWQASHCVALYSHALRPYTLCKNAVFSCICDCAGGEKCGNEGAGKPRQVELRWACSPHNSWRMLVREPQFCAYVVTVYHPGLCKVPRYAPVPVKQQMKEKGGAKDAAAKDAAGKPGSKEGKEEAAAAAAGRDAAGKAAAAGRQGQGEDAKGAGGKASKEAGGAKFGDKPVAA